ncbi:MAG: hypothetical protein WBL95_24180 [Microcoleus sp.]
MRWDSKLLLFPKCDRPSPIPNLKERSPLFSLHCDRPYFPCIAIAP